MGVCLGVCQDGNVHLRRRLMEEATSAPSASPVASRVSYAGVFPGHILHGERGDDLVNKNNVNPYESLNKRRASVGIFGHRVW